MTTRNHTDDVAYFIAFCIESYKNEHGIDGAEASRIFAAHDVINYLADNYEVLHTQSPQWILDEIDELINR